MNRCHDSLPMVPKDDFEVTLGFSGFDLLETTLEFPLVDEFHDTDGLFALPNFHGVLTIEE